MFLTALPLVVLNIDTAGGANPAGCLRPRCRIRARWCCGPAMIMVERHHDFARGFARPKSVTLKSRGAAEAVIPPLQWSALA
jgi:hypothetical protein